MNYADWLAAPLWKDLNGDFEYLKNGNDLNLL
jgi:hypothetical protein